METKPENAVARRAAALTKALPEARQDIAELVAGLTEADLDKPTVHTAWTVRQAFGHIIDATEMLATCLEKAKGGASEGTLRPEAMAPTMERDAITRAEGMTLAAIGSTFNTAAARLLGLLTEREAQGTWEELVPHPYLGTCPAIMIAGLALVDWFIHPWDIRDGLGQSPQPHPTHALLVTVGLIGLLPRRLDKQEAAQMSSPAIYRYIIESEPPLIFDVIVENEKARVEPRSSEETSTDLSVIFKGPPAELVLAMLGRRSPAPLLKQSSPEHLARFKKLWISL